MSAPESDSYEALPAGVARILAPNPSVMTGPGTNTFLVADEAAGAVVVIDPGPDIPEHVAMPTVASFVRCELGRRAVSGKLVASRLGKAHPDEIVW